MSATEKLNQLAELRSQLDSIRLHFDDLRKSVIPPEVQRALEEIQAEQAAAEQAASAGIEALTNEIKALVVAHGDTINGDYLQAVYSKGRVSWDTKQLDGYAVAHPEIEKFRKVGEPSVSIRAKNAK